MPLADAVAARAAAAEQAHPAPQEAVECLVKFRARCARNAPCSYPLLTSATLSMELGQLAGPDHPPTPPLKNLKIYKNSPDGAGEGMRAEMGVVQTLHTVKQSLHMTPLTASLGYAPYGKN